MTAQSFPEACRPVLAGVSFLLFLSVAVALPVEAHQSEFDTLTLDFLIGVGGLRWVDAAVVENAGPGYEPFPSPEKRHHLAVGVFEALEVPLEQVEIDADASARYHEVGFLAEVRHPSLGPNSVLRIDTADLQRLIADAGFERLKLSICGVTQDPESSDPAVLTTLVVLATQSGRPATAMDRPGCEVWALTAADAAVSITVRAEAPPDPGQNGIFIPTAALAALLIAVVLLSGAQVRRRQVSEPSRTA